MPATVPVLLAGCWRRPAACSRRISRRRSSRRATARSAHSTQPRPAPHPRCRHGNRGDEMIIEIDLCEIASAGEQGLVQVRVRPGAHSGWACWPACFPLHRPWSWTQMWRSTVGSGFGNRRPARSPVRQWRRRPPPPRRRRGSTPAGVSISLRSGAGMSRWPGLCCLRFGPAQPGRVGKCRCTRRETRHVSAAPQRQGPLAGQKGWRRAGGWRRTRRGATSSHCFSPALSFPAFPPPRCFQATSTPSSCSQFPLQYPPPFHACTPGLAWISSAA